MTPVQPIDANRVPRFAGLRTFARLPRLEDVPEADIAILGAPFDGGTTFRPGARFGPAAVRDASVLLRPYDPALGLAPFEHVQVVDAGDAPANPVDILAAHDAILRRATALHRAGAAVVGIGGDHSVSLPLLAAAAKTHGPLGLVQLDAHTDTWDAYFGSRLTHGTMFRRAIEEGHLDPHRSVQVGLRGSLYASTDPKQNDSLGFRTFYAQEIQASGVESALKTIRDTARGPTYVTVDVDVLDPAFAPGTGTPEVGGLTTRELLVLLAGIAKLRDVHVVSGDVVEVAPAYDQAGITAMAAATAAYHLVGALALRRLHR